MHHRGHQQESQSLNRLALSATIHCLTGCSIGEVLGMVIGTALGWGNWETVALAVMLAFFFGYLLTLVPLLRRMTLKAAITIALASDTLSILVMEVVDNGVMMAIPGAMKAPLTSGLFWGALIGSLMLAGVAAYPINRWLVSKGVKHCH